jgi:hypothetical protein
VGEEVYIRAANRCRLFFPIWHTDTRTRTIIYLTKILWKLIRELNFLWGGAVLRFKLRALCLLGRCSTTRTTLPAHFCIGYFWDTGSWTICLGWPQITILLISASQGARLTDMSHWCLAVKLILIRQLRSWFFEGGRRRKQRDLQKQVRGFLKLLWP